MNKTGILLINVGTPQRRGKKATRRYLKQFLSDPRIIDLPLAMRWPFVNVCLVPFRVSQSAKAYSKIWLPQGSPLLFYSEQLKKRLTAQLNLNMGSHYQVELGMRYGSPSIPMGLNKLKHCQNLIILPLFPQYSSATSGSAIEDVMHHLKKQWNIPAIKVINHFYNTPEFITAYAELIKENITSHQDWSLLLSYHSLPQRHINKSGCQIKCKDIACPVVTEQNTYCYRAQCYETSRLLARALNLNETQYKVSFQSRLGKIPWITPYTDLMLETLARDGIKHITVACPSFVVDCLETLEEIGIRAQKKWYAIGGQTLQLVPCLNDHPLWVRCLTELIATTYT